MQLDPLRTGRGTVASVFREARLEVALVERLEGNLAFALQGVPDRAVPADVGGYGEAPGREDRGGGRSTRPAFSPAQLRSRQRSGFEVEVVVLEEAARLNRFDEFLEL